jgi:hypothetical protein
MDLKKCLMIIILPFIFISCSGNKEKQFAAEKAKAAPSPSAFALKEENNASAKTGIGTNKLSFVFLTPTEEAKDRLLEYQAHLTYKTGSFEGSRKELLSIIGQYGFINSSTADIRNLNSSMTAQLSVRVGSLYSVLQELDRLGNLEAENIAVRDHTGDMSWTQRKIKREQLRIGRRSKVLFTVSSGSTNWKEAEDALSKSEDSLDENEQGDWTIHDTTAWAKITVTIEGPSMPEPIRIPAYQNAVVTLINILLQTAYILIILIPLIIIAVLVIWKRKAIMGYIKKK